jgi:hypothetical protein
VRIKLSTAGLIAAIFAIAIAAATVSWSHRRGVPSARNAGLCMRNMVGIWQALDHSLGRGSDYPSSFATFTNWVKNPWIFVCPATKNQPGTMANVDGWTDYIYVANLSESYPSKIPLLICPPENHGGAFGHIFWLGGGEVETLSPDRIRLLIQTPWIYENNSPSFTLYELKRDVRVRIPPRLAKYYANVYKPINLKSGQ